MSSVAEAVAVAPAPPPPAEDPHLAAAQRAIEAKKIFHKAVNTTEVRHDWTREEISAIYYQPLMELAFQAVRCRLISSHPQICTHTHRS